MTCKEVVEIVSDYLEDALSAAGPRAVRGASGRVRRLHHLRRHLREMTA